MRISDWSSYVCSSDLGFDDDRRRKVPVDRQDGLLGNIVEPHLLRHRSQFDELFVAQALTRFMAEKREFQRNVRRSEEHTSELQSLMRISYAVFCLKKKKAYTQ